MMTTLAFGSCNRQNLPQNYWKVILECNPQLFLWTGDAVYASSNDLDGVQNAYKELLSSEYYYEMKQSVNIDGVWDDHDYGVNDAGSTITHKRERQEEFLRFLEYNQSSHLWQQDGLYHSRDLTYKDLKIKIIFLDTRSHREYHYLRSVGEFHFPLSALIAAFIRLVSTTFGLSKHHTGDMLGASQWRWLEKTISSSSADVHILVSSVQILTTNPVVESWGHFPLAKQRLLNLLRRLDPPGLVFLSGDVHHGEISSLKFVRESGEQDEWVEVTSSGLTHNCGDSFVTRLLCPLMLSYFNKHRRSHDSYAIANNFGLISIMEEAQVEKETAYNAPADLSEYQSSMEESVWSSSRAYIVNISVHDIDNRQSLLSHSLRINKRPTTTRRLSNSSVLSSPPLQDLPGIVSIDLLEFDCLSRNQIVCFASIFVVLLLVILRHFGRRKKSSSKKYVKKYVKKML